MGTSDRPEPMGAADLFPHQAGFPPPVTNVAGVAADTVDLRLVADATDWERLAGLSSLERLWCFRVNQARMTTIARCLSLKRLYLDGVRTPVDALCGLRRLVVLSIDSATRLASLQEVPMSDGLEGLSLLNAPRVISLGPLGERTGLKALAVSAGIWSKMTVDSLDPLRSLTGLQYLQLYLRVLDHSLEPLEALTGLRTLELSNDYPLEEFARLSARLKHTECRWFAPTADLPGVTCKRCGELGLVVLTGKGTPTLCRSCDDQRIRKHVDLFQRLAASAA